MVITPEEKEPVEEDDDPWEDNDEPWEDDEGLGEEPYEEPIDGDYGDEEEAGDPQNNIQNECLRTTISEALASNMNVEGMLAGIMNNLTGSNSNVTLNFIDTLTSGTASTTKSNLSTTTNTIYNINFNSSYFSDISKEAVVTQLIHEVVHAHLLETDNAYKSQPKEEQHNFIFQNYVDEMAEYLIEKYNMSRDEAFGLAWSGTDLYKESGFEDEFPTKMDGDVGERYTSKSDLHFAQLPYVQTDPQLEQKGTPNCNK